MKKKKKHEKGQVSCRNTLQNFGSQYEFFKKIGNQFIISEIWSQFAIFETLRANL